MQTHHSQARRSTAGSRPPGPAAPSLPAARRPASKARAPSAPGPAAQQPFPAGASDAAWLEQREINTVALTGKKPSSPPPASPRPTLPPAPAAPSHTVADLSEQGGRSRGKPTGERRRAPGAPGADRGRGGRATSPCGPGRSLGGRAERPRRRPPGARSGRQGRQERAEGKAEPHRPGAHPRPTLTSPTPEKEASSPRARLFIGAAGPAPDPPALRREGGRRRHLGRYRSGCPPEPRSALPCCPLRSSARRGPSSGEGDGLDPQLPAPAGLEPVEVA